MPEVATTPAGSPDWEAQLEEVYRLVAEQKIDQAIDIVFETVDDLLCRERFADCDGLLDGVDVDRLDANLLVAFLTITAAARDRLAARERLVSRVALALRRVKGEAYAALLHRVA